MLEKILKPAMTRCKSCSYEALTWHEDLDKLRCCRKCQGELEVLKKEK